MRLHTLSGFQLMSAIYSLLIFRDKVTETKVAHKTMMSKKKGQAKKKKKELFSCIRTTVKQSLQIILTPEGIFQRFLVTQKFVCVRRKGQSA